ncbi:MAG TPA: FkbM family methyltransferase, partial [Bryobacteraceae bacterium]|nr:FkbM family methyltransferase [Bryobacteraceae bacterium]
MTRVIHIAHSVACVALLAGIAAGLLLLAYPGSVTGLYLLRGGVADVCRVSDAAAGMQKHLAIRERGTALTAASIVERRSGEYELLRTPHGSWWMPRGNHAPVAEMLGQQLHQIYGDVRAGSIVLDCGAHIGLFAREALSRGAARVVAIEPAAENLECLRRNLAPELLAGRVVIYPKGVWETETVLRFHKVEGNSGGDSFVIDNGPGGSVEVPVTTIDKLVSELRLDRVDFIKMDIKGAEREALRGATAVMRRWKPALAVAAEHRPDDDVVLPRIIREAWAGYTAVCGSCYARNG